MENKIVGLVNRAKELKEQYANSSINTELANLCDEYANLGDEIISILSSNKEDVKKFMVVVDDPIIHQEDYEYILCGSYEECFDCIVDDVMRDGANKHTVIYGNDVKHPHETTTREKLHAAIVNSFNEHACVEIDNIYYRIVEPKIYQRKGNINEV